MINLYALSEIEILSLTIIGEARGEPIEGQVAVGSVIRNRTRKRNQSYHNVCLAPLQFSCWNIKDPNRSVLLDLADRMVTGEVIDDPFLKQCIFVAKGIVENDLVDNVKGVQHYMTTSLFHSPSRPSWAKMPFPVMVKGNQTFFGV